MRVAPHREDEQRNREQKGRAAHGSERVWTRATATLLAEGVGVGCERLGRVVDAAAGHRDERAVQRASRWCFACGRARHVRVGGIGPRASGR